MCWFLEIYHSFEGFFISVLDNMFHKGLQITRF